MHYALPEGRRNGNLRLCRREERICNIEVYGDSLF
jgi:hypothetical protein